MKPDLLLLLPLALTACSGAPGPQTCPQVAIVHELGQIADYARDDETQGLGRLVTSGRMLTVEGGCSFHKGRVESEFTLKLRAWRGRGLGGDSVELPYFVAVVRQDEVPVSKQNYAARLHFEAGKLTTESDEPLRVTIPAADVAGWRILTGFQLSPEQLAYNRAELRAGKAGLAP